MSNSATKLLLAAGVTEVPRGESLYAIPGTYTWVCPDGVTSVSAVLVGCGGSYQSSSSGGGGELRYINNYSVTPGTSYTIVVGKPDMDGNGQNTTALGVTATAGPRGGTSYVAGSGGVLGGRGGEGGSGRGGGGAGGYSGNGGNGGSQNQTGSSGTGGAGGGGYGNDGNAGGGGGGGVGLFGAGASGAGGIPSGTFTKTPARGGSGGEDQPGVVLSTGLTNRIYGGSGGNFGGGAAGPISTYDQGIPGNGAVRIVWPGDTRQFPLTDVGTP